MRLRVLHQLAPAALLASLALVLPACARRGSDVAVAPGAPPRVVLLTVDTLRADHVGAYGYPRDTTPAADRLAREGVLFEQAIAQWPKTGASFASLFTGRYAQTTGLTHKAALELPRRYLTLAELFRELGYTTAAVVSNPVLAARLGWDQGFGEYLETFAEGEPGSDDPRVFRRWLNAVAVNRLALPLLERLASSPRVFLWIHYSDPHAPYVLPDGYDNPFLGDPHDRGDALAEFDDVHGAQIDDRRELRYYVAQYDANVRVVDQHMGELLGRARELGLLDDALVVYTADHGESLGEHGYFFGHGRLPYNTTARVPLVLARSGAGGQAADGWPAGLRIDRPVELIDLYPTLRDVIAPGRRIDGLEGDSLLPLFADGAAASATGGSFRHAFSEAGGGGSNTYFRTVQAAGWKMVYHPPVSGKGGERPALYELYDLAADPLESQDLAAERTAELRELRRVLFGWMKGEEWIAPPPESPEERSEETQKALRALGYVN